MLYAVCISISLVLVLIPDCSPSPKRGMKDVSLYGIDTVKIVLIILIENYAEG
jgi:hypothetical protein